MYSQIFATPAHLFIYLCKCTETFHMAQNQMMLFSTRKMIKYLKMSALEVATTEEQKNTQKKLRKTEINAQIWIFM